MQSEQLSQVGRKALAVRGGSENTHGLQQERVVKPGGEEKNRKGQRVGSVLFGNQPTGQQNPN